MKRLAAAFVYGLAEMLPTTMGLLFAILFMRPLIGDFGGYLVGGFLLMMFRIELRQGKKQISKDCKPWSPTIFAGIVLGIFLAALPLRLVKDEFYGNPLLICFGLVVGCVIALLIANLKKISSKTGQSP